MAVAYEFLGLIDPVVLLDDAVVWGLGIGDS